MIIPFAAAHPTFAVLSIAVVPVDDVEMRAVLYPVELDANLATQHTIHRPGVNLNEVRFAIPLVALASVTEVPVFVTMLSVLLALYDAVVFPDESKNTNPVVLICAESMPDESMKVVTPSNVSSSSGAAVHSVAFTPFCILKLANS